MNDYPQSLIRYPHTNNSLLSSGNAKKSTTYEPRTEAISPAINDDIINAEDSSSKSTKDEQTLLVEKLRKVEDEIMQTDLKIVRLRRQKEQLEQAASSHNKNDDDQENVCDTKQLSIAKLVYHENRAKAQRAHSKLDCLGGCPSDLPIYNQPSDNFVYHQNNAKFNSSFKRRLITCFRKRLTGRQCLEESVSSEYDRRMGKWLKKIEAEDSQPSKRIKDAKTREFFEKQFPELKKARESGERFSRVGQRVARSDAEVAELLDGITEREDQDKKVKSYAVIPPMLEEMRTKKPKFINTNGYVEDLIAEYKEHQILNMWTDEEKEVFKENYLQHPKDFGLIARMTTRKTVADCVQYYYLSKKSENYKQLLKRQQKRRTRSFVRPTQSNSAANNASADNNNDSTKASSSCTNSTKQGGDHTMNDITNEQTDGYKAAVPDGQGSEGIDSKDSNNVIEEATCCICQCNLGENNQFRNVTRSNHQLYGIGRETLKPGMKICYPCRFRHVKHPSFDEPYLSPEPMDFIEDLNEATDMNAPVIQEETKLEQKIMKNENSVAVTYPPSPTCGTDKTQNQSDMAQGDFNTGSKRTCVRDIIYQAIEMSFQKPKPIDLIDIKQEQVRTDGLITTPMNPIPPPHPIVPNVSLTRPTLVPNNPVGILPVPMSTPVALPSNLALRQMPDRHFSQVRQQPFQVAPLAPHQQQKIPQQFTQQMHQAASIPNPPLSTPPPLHHVQRLSTQPIRNQVSMTPVRVIASQPSLPQITIPATNHTLLTTTVPVQPGGPTGSNLNHVAGNSAPPSARQAAGGAPSAHPLNLCRKYNEPGFTPDQVKTKNMKNGPPPNAHSAKSQSTRGGSDDGCVLNLSAKAQPPKNAAVRVQPSPPDIHQAASQHPVPQIIKPSPKDEAKLLRSANETKSEPISPPPSVKSPVCRSERAISKSPPDGFATGEVPLSQLPTTVSIQSPQQPTLALETHLQGPHEEEESRSPNLTGSPTSPSEMVIDESADVGSPASSSPETAGDEAKGAD